MNKWLGSVNGLIATLALCGGAAPGQSATPACGRGCLTTKVDAYLAALAAHDPSAAPLARTVRITENGVDVRVGEGLWKTAGPIGKIRRYAVDPETSNVAVQLLMQNAGVPTIALFRAKVVGNNITEVETVIAEKGKTAKGVFFEDDSFAAEPQPEWGSIIPIKERQSRASLAAAAEAYFNALNTTGTPAFKNAPFSDDCDRFENGKRVTNVDFMGHPPMTCTEQLNSISRDTQRKSSDPAFIKETRVALVDVKKGIALAYSIFGGSSAPGEAPAPAFLVGDLFKIVKGKLFRVQITYDGVPQGTSTGW